MTEGHWDNSPRDTVPYIQTGKVTMVDLGGMGHGAVGTDFKESNGCWDNLKLGPMVFGTKCSWDL